MIIFTEMPREAPIAEREMPVFPLEASTSIDFSLISPDSIAFLTI